VDHRLIRSSALHPVTQSNGGWSHVSELPAKWAQSEAAEHDGITERIELVEARSDSSEAR
jgi:hypothetical protein